MAKTADALVDALAAAATDVAAEAGVAVDAVGVGMPGLIDAEGVVRVAPNLRLCEGVDLRSALFERLGGCPVSIDNDVTCAGRGSGRRRGGRPVDVVLVALGTGIGGGLIVDGRIARGANGFAGEVGHIVVDPSGRGARAAGGAAGSGTPRAAGSGASGREAAQAGRLAKGMSGRAATPRRAW